MRGTVAWHQSEGALGEPAIGLEEQFKEIAGFVALAIEAAAVLVVSYGALQALAGLVGSALSRTADEMIGREIWLKFATWILLALELPLPPISCARRSRRRGTTSRSSR